MFQELINSLTFTYSYIARAGKRLSTDHMKALQAGAHTLGDTAPIVLPDMDTLNRPADADLRLKEAQLVTTHIDEVVAFLMSQEIV